MRYAGPIDGHDVDLMEQAFAHAAEWDGPIVVHVLTQKGRGYAPAEQDDVQRLHDVKATKIDVLENTIGSSAGAAVGGSGGADGGGVASPGSSPDVEPHRSPQWASTYTEAFSRAILQAADRDPRVVALTAAMPGPTGLLPFQARFPTRFFDVGIAEQHEVTAAAGMAMAGIRPVVAVYSTFFSRAFDQANLDVGLHGSPVVFVLDRAGITGDDGPSHHGILDMALALAIPGMTVFAPSAAEELAPMLTAALELPGPSTIRFPKTAPRHVEDDQVGHGPAGPPAAPGRWVGLPARSGKTRRGLPVGGRRVGDRRRAGHRMGRACGLAAGFRHVGRRRPARPSWSRPRMGFATAGPEPSSSDAMESTLDAQGQRGPAHPHPRRPPSVLGPGQGGRHPRSPRPSTAPASPRPSAGARRPAPSPAPNPAPAPAARPRT